MGRSTKIGFNAYLDEDNIYKNEELIKKFVNTIYENYKDNAYEEDIEDLESVYYQFKEKYNVHFISDIFNYVYKNYKKDEPENLCPFYANYLDDDSSLLIEINDLKSYDEVYHGYNVSKFLEEKKNPEELFSEQYNFLLKNDLLDLWNMFSWNIDMSEYFN